MTSSPYKTENKSLKSDIDYPRFEDLPVSTKTFIITTNVTFNLQKLFDFLPVTNYIIVPKRRGRKKKNVPLDPNRNISAGSIITLEYGNQLRGVQLKKKKKKEGKSADFFRNSMTVVMITGGKKINFKISRNGKFQMTGCKTDEQAENCVKRIFDLVRETEDIYTLPDGENFTALFIPAMRNTDFSLGFLVDREKLDEFFNTYTPYYSLLETSIGYTGVNIKIPVKKSILDLELREITYEDGWQEPVFVPFQKHLDQLKPKERQKKLDKERHTTFLVFQSGRAIQSAMCHEFAEDVYYEFLDIIKNDRDYFEEHLGKNDLVISPLVKKSRKVKFVD